MRLSTLEKLLCLRQEFRAGPFGKVAQKFLALSFCELGFGHVVERGVQGVDIDVAGGGQRLALEVKTTLSNSVVVDRNNLNALRQRVADEYEPGIAVLRLVRFEDWVVARLYPEQVRPGSIPIERFRSHRMIELEQVLRPAFEVVVDRHYDGTLKGGQGYLNDCLLESGVDVQE